MDLADIPAAAAFLGAQQQQQSAAAASSATTSVEAATESDDARRNAAGDASAPPAAPTTTMTTRRCSSSEHSSEQSGMTMDPSAAAATLLDAARYYPGAAAAAAAAAAANTGNAANLTTFPYYAQNLAGFAASTFMAPMYGFGVFGGPQPGWPMGPGGPAGFYGHSGLAGPQQTWYPPPSSQHQQQQPTATSSSSLTLPPPHSQPLYDMDTTALQSQIAAQFTQATPEQQSLYYESVRAQLDTAASGLDETQKQALLSRDPSLIFSMAPLELVPKQELDLDPQLQPQSAPSTSASRSKRARVASRGPDGDGPSAPAPSPAAPAKKKPKKSKKSPADRAAAAAAAMATGGEPTDLSLQQHVPKEEPIDGPASASSSSTTRRPTASSRSGRPPGATARAAAAAAGYELTPSGKKKSMTPQAEEARQRKAKMAWTKGTFLIRLQDVKVRSGRDHIWLVDNHQLLQRFNNESGSIRADGSRIYHKTDRYTGWLCHEGFHYFPLFENQHVIRQDGDTVTVLFPSEDELHQAIEYQEQEKARRADAPMSDEGRIRPLPPSLRNLPARYGAALAQQQQAAAASAAYAAVGSTSMTSSVMAKEESPSSSMMMMVKQEGGRRGGWERGAGGSRSQQRVSSASPSCSLNDLLPSTSSRAAAARRLEMPSLSRHDYWSHGDEGGSAEQQQLMHLQHDDDNSILAQMQQLRPQYGASGSNYNNMDNDGMLLLDEDIMDDRECKREQAEDPLADHSYTSML